FSFIQFAYRLVSYCDLFLFVTVVLLLLSLGPNPLKSSQPLTICLMAAVALNAAGLMIKAGHVTATEMNGVLAGSEFRSDRNALLRTPKGFYWAGDYGVSKGIAPEPENNNGPKINTGFAVGKDSQFGEIAPTQLRLSAESLLI